MPKTILMTGATGNIGGRLLAELLAKEPKAKLALLVRADSNRSARERIEEVLKTYDPGCETQSLWPRLTLLCGDVERERLGLSEAGYRELAGMITHIVHSAAATSFVGSVVRARSVNVGGTIRVLELAKRAFRKGRLKRLTHVSTAYINDRTSDERSTEGGGFSNAYERSKWEAENYVQAQMQSLPIVIVRPSIVVGDSRTGQILHFNVLYPPLQLIVKGLLKAMPCPADVHLNVVPVDYVAAALRHLTLSDNAQAGRTYYLTAGSGQTMSIQEIVERTVATAGLSDSLEPVGFGVTGSSRALPRRIALMLEAYHPYLADRQFDDQNEPSLQAEGITVPPLDTYLSVIIDYAIKNNWGRRDRKAA